MMTPSLHHIHNHKTPSRLGLRAGCVYAMVVVVICNFVWIYAAWFTSTPAVAVESGRDIIQDLPTLNDVDKNQPTRQEKAHDPTFTTPFAPIINSTTTSPNNLTSLYIPRKIHITVPTKFVSDSVNNNIANWKSQNPTFTLTLYDDADMLKMVTEEGEPLIPGMLDVYTSFQKNVERADFWRYLVVYLYGGVYVDSDVFPKQPLDTWHRFFDPEKAVGVPHLTLLNDTRVDGPWIQGFVGAEAHLTEPQRIQQNFAFRIQWCQWAFAFRPRHPFLLKLLRSIITHVHGERNGTVKSSGSWLIDLLMRTGPGRFTVVVEEWLKEQSRGRGGMLTSEDVVSGYEVVGSVGFMPPYAFGYRGWVDPPPPSADRLLVEHQFHQSWVQPPK